MTRPRRIGIRQLKNEASRIVNDVRERGTEYLVTRRGEPVARLVAVGSHQGEEEERLRIAEALERLRKTARIVAAQSTDESAVSAVRHQRR